MQELKTVALALTKSCAGKVYIKVGCGQRGWNKHSSKGQLCGLTSLVQSWYHRTRAWLAIFLNLRA